MKTLTLSIDDRLYAKLQIAASLETLRSGKEASIENIAIKLINHNLKKYLDPSIFKVRSIMAEPISNKTCIIKIENTSSIHYHIQVPTASRKFFHENEPIELIVDSISYHTGYKSGKLCGGLKSFFKDHPQLSGKEKVLKVEIIEPYKKFLCLDRF